MMSRHRLEAAKERLRNPDEDAAGLACSTILEAVQLVAPFDCAAVMSADPTTLLPTRGVFSGLDSSVCEPFWRSESSAAEVLRFVDLARRPGGVATLSERLPDGFEPSQRYREVFSALALGDELRVVFRAGGACFGMASFLRADGGRPFSPKEMDAVRQLSAPVVELLRGDMLAPPAERPAATPVMATVGPAGELLSRTPGFDAVLADLTAGAIGAVALPPTLVAPLMRVQSQTDAKPLLTRVRGQSGAWYRLCLSPFEECPDRFALSLELTRASDLVPLFLRSHGLTGRELQVVSELLRGLSAKEIATSLAISTHTVRDHIKSTYQKMGVHSRGELHARLLLDDTGLDAPWSDSADVATAPDDDPLALGMA